MSVDDVQAPAKRELAGQVAMVTGAARGIGLATAELLLAQGARVVLADLDAQAALDAAQQMGGATAGAIGQTLDVTNEATVREVVDWVNQEVGQVSILVNNAGTTRPATPVWETSTEHFMAMLEVHLLGTFFCARAVVPGMRSAGYGRVVNVASVAAKEGNAGSGAYSAAKAGVVALTKSLGKELATDGITVNAVTPGVIDTTMVQQSSKEHIDRLTAKIPMGRRGRRAEIAEMIAWVASPRCSFTTGSVFDVSGGRTTY